MNRSYKLLYDGECGPCVRFAAEVRRWDRQEAIELTPLQDHFELDQSIPLEDLLREIHLLDREGAVFRGAEAIHRVLELVPQTRPMRWMIESRAAKQTTRVVYSFMKRLRKKRCRSCK